MSDATPTLVWFRQDLRLKDQAAVAAAAREGPLVGVYVLDDEAPGDWRIGGAQRWWLHQSLTALAASLEAHGASLVLRRGRAVDELVSVAKAVGASRVHCLSHYEPWWREAETQLADHLELVRHDGYLLINPGEVRTGSDGSFRVFSPFWKALQAKMPPAEPTPAPKTLQGVAKPPQTDSLASWRLLPDGPDWTGGFADWKPGEDGAHGALDAFSKRLGGYGHDRNLPAVDGSSRLSPHLHMGEISPAEIWHRLADEQGAEPFLRELAWRDFTSDLIIQLPHYADETTQPSMKAMKWREGEAADADFKAWTRGRTGYPIVDAGMRQLWHMGWMHNRVRMLTASFLIKHLLLDWRRGEAWFWDCLIDADYGNNSVNWQWVAGTGVDSAPFYRIMAPLSQSEKFDAADYIRRWVPELKDLDDATIHDPHGLGKAPSAYPKPLISHKEGRERALEAVRAARSA